MRWQANACRTFSGGSAAGACATRTGSTALGAGQRSANVSACASVAVQIAATVRSARLAILVSPIGFHVGDETLACFLYTGFGLPMFSAVSIAMRACMMKLRPS